MSSPLDAFGFASPNWLRSLRWFAIAGISATIVGGYVFVGAEVPWFWTVFFVGGLTLWNFFLPSVESKFELSNRGYIVLQIFVDLVVLTAILWLSGGLVNPFAAFYIFHLMIAGLLLDRFWTTAVAGLVIVFVFLLYFAGPLNVEGRAIELHDSPIWPALPLALVLLIVFTTAFILGYLNRLARAQEESEERAKMAALGGLVGGLAHELGTPLNTILLVAKDLALTKPAAERQDLELIADQAKRCGDLVGVLLGYSRSVSRDLHFQRVTFEGWLRGIYQETLKSVEIELAGTPIDFDVRNFTGKRSLELPELALHQVLGNLIKNGLQSITAVRDPRLVVEVWSAETNERIRILVRDNGPGFSGESRRRAFEAFFSTKSPGEGNGLGLYISYHLMRQIGGRITIPIELQNNGAVVEVVAPVQRSNDDSDSTHN